MSFEGDLSGAIRAWQGKKVLVVGDAMWDVYHFGHVERMSQEAPVPIFLEDHEERRPGGAGNVVANLEALGCVPSFYFAPQPWSVKHRWIAGHHQLLRVDFDQQAEAVEPQLEFCDLMEEAHAVVLSDYAKGWLDASTCQWVIGCAHRLKIPVIVDPKGSDWSKYLGATVVCPNSQELLAAQNQEHPPTAWDLIAKCGEKGITLYTHNGRQTQTFEALARHVYDVTGAGDTVVAVVAATLAAGVELHTAAYLANLAASHVVGEVGTATCSAEQLMELCR